jgi:hypothetical protein
MPTMQSSSGGVHSPFSRFPNYCKYGDINLRCSGACSTARITAGYWLCLFGTYQLHAAVLNSDMISIQRTLGQNRHTIKLSFHYSSHDPHCSVPIANPPYLKITLDISPSSP